MDNIIPCYHFLIFNSQLSTYNQVFTSHFSRLLHTQNMQDGRSYIRQYTVLYLSILIGRNINKRNGIQRVGRIRRTVLVQGMVGITVVGTDDYLVRVDQ